MTHPRYLLVIAHGSRRAASNEEVMRFSERMGAAVVGTEDNYAGVGCAFLELAEPTIPDAIDRAVAQGAAHVDVFPYFLAAGRHVTEDIPAIVAGKRNEHPGVTFRVLDHFGAWDNLPELVAAGLKEN